MNDVQARTGNGKTLMLIVLNETQKPPGRGHPSRHCKERLISPYERDTADLHLILQEQLGRAPNMSVAPRSFSFTPRIDGGPNKLGHGTQRALIYAT
jgi:hypothetical protein